MSMTTLNEPKALEIHRLHALIGDSRLDATQAISFAIDAMDHYVPGVHDSDESRTKQTSRQILWKISEENLNNRLTYIKMFGVTVRAFDILRSERSV